MGVVYTFDTNFPSVSHHKTLNYRNVQKNKLYRDLYILITIK